MGEDGCPVPSQSNYPKVDLSRLGIVQVVRQVDLSTEAISLLQLEDPSLVDGFVPGLGLSPLWGLPVARALDGREDVDLGLVGDCNAADGVGEEQGGGRAGLAPEEDLGVDEVKPISRHHQLVVFQLHTVGHEGIGTRIQPQELPLSVDVGWSEGEERGGVSQCDPVSSTLHILALKFCPPPTSGSCPLCVPTSHLAVRF